MEGEGGEEGRGERGNGEGDHDEKKKKKKKKKNPTGDDTARLIIGKDHFSSPKDTKQQQQRQPKTKTAILKGRVVFLPQNKFTPVIGSDWSGPSRLAAHTTSTCQSC